MQMDSSNSSSTDVPNQLMGFTQKIPGFVLCIAVGTSVIVLSKAFQAPVMLLAIILGLALHSLNSISRLTPGIQWTSNTILYFGVALMGLRIDLTDISLTGWSAPVVVILILLATLAFGYLFSRLLRQPKNFSLLIAGSVAICGVSAAVAMSGAMRETKDQGCHLAVTIAGITFLSTAAMIVYPIIAMKLGLNSLSAGIFMGGSIHNVSQAVGAGYVVSGEAGDITVLLKLIRVSTLLPIVVLVSVLNGQNLSTENSSIVGKALSYFPPFLIGFLCLAVMSCLQIIPEPVTKSGNVIAELCLIVSLVAIGIKTKIKDVLSVGFKPLLSLTLTTLFMAALALGAALIFPL